MSSTEIKRGRQTKIEQKATNSSSVFLALAGNSSADAAYNTMYKAATDSPIVDIQVQWNTDICIRRI